MANDDEVSTTLERVPWACLSAGIRNHSGRWTTNSLNPLVGDEFLTLHVISEMITAIQKGYFLPRMGMGGGDIK